MATICPPTWTKSMRWWEASLIYDYDSNSVTVCQQFDVLVSLTQSNVTDVFTKWENLTGEEHLLFYGRLRNLSGKHLHSVVDAALRKVNLFDFRYWECKHLFKDWIGKRWLGIIQGYVFLACIVLTLFKRAWKGDCLLRLPCWQLRPQFTSTSRQLDLTQRAEWYFHQTSINI